MEYVTLPFSACENSSLTSSPSLQNILGPQFVYTEEKPVYRSAAYAMLGSYIGKTVCHVALGVYMYLDNKKRDKNNGPADVKMAAERGMQNVTVRPSFSFFYLYLVARKDSALKYYSILDLSTLQEKDNPDFRYVL